MILWSMILKQQGFFAKMLTNLKDYKTVGKNIHFLKSTHEIMEFFQRFHKKTFCKMITYV